MNDYENMYRIRYNSGATFVPVCIKCGRFVKADKTVKISEGLGLSEEPNAKCSKCGRSHMLFEGFI